MKLDVARLCLDCEEVHELQHCPACGSEAFAFLTRWIEPSVEPKPDGRRQRPRAPEAQAVTEQVETYRQLLDGQPRPRRTGLVTKGMLGLAAFSLAGWAWRNASRGQGLKPAGEGPPKEPKKPE